MDPCWRGLLESRTAIAPLLRFSTVHFGAAIAATVAGLEYHGRQSLVMQMLKQLAGELPVLPKGTDLLLASTKGEIDLLEMSLLTGEGSVEESRLDRLLAKVTALFGASGKGMVISAACTSSAVAAARAASMIRSGDSSSVLVVACDAVTEFIYAGFSSLMALDTSPARPFDRNRSGLSLGEAAAAMLLMSEERAVAEKRPFRTEIAGWGMSDDANHMTGPSRESEGLVRAIRTALAGAATLPEDVGFISAHGTGTIYNDAMEMRGFNEIFQGSPLPVYSIKGAVGHTMGTAGLLEILIAERALAERLVPPTVNLQVPDDDAFGKVDAMPQSVAAGKVAMVTNAGFSGINSAVVLRSL
jgi:3-oxoacyl-[acyl-carrier-protein] synthase II